MRRRHALAVTSPATLREASALEPIELDRHTAAREIVTVQRQGDRLTFDPKAIAAQLKVPPEHVRVSKGRDGRVYVHVWRQMADTRFGYWQDFATERVAG